MLRAQERIDVNLFCVWLQIKAAHIWEPVLQKVRRLVLYWRGVLLFILLGWPMAFHNAQHELATPGALAVLLGVITAPLWEREAECGEQNKQKQLFG